MSNPREVLKAQREERVEAEYRKEMERYKQLDKLKQKDRIRREKLRQDASAVKWLCVIGVANVIMMTVPLVGGHWIGTSFGGFGVGYTTIRVGLANIEIDMKCQGKNAVEDRICRMIEGGMEGGQGIAGIKKISEVRQLVCSSLTPRACNILDRLWAVMWVVIFWFGLAILAQFLSIMLLYYYWNVSPHPTIRKTSMIFTIVTPFSLLIGLGMYVMLKPDLIEFPRTWSTIMTSLTAEVPFFAIKPVYNFEIAWCFVWACFALLFTVINAAAFFLCLNKNQGEEELEDIEEWERDKVLEESLMLTEKQYGSGFYGAPGASQPIMEKPYAGSPPAAYDAYGGGGGAAVPLGFGGGTYDGGGDGTYGGGGGAYGGGFGGASYGGSSGVHTVVYDSRTGPPVPPQMLAGAGRY